MTNMHEVLKRGWQRKLDSLTIASAEVGRRYEVIGHWSGDFIGELTSISGFGVLTLAFRLDDGEIREVQNSNKIRVREATHIGPVSHDA